MRLLSTIFRGKRIIIIALVLVALAIGALLKLDLRGHTLAFLEWLEGQGLWAPLFFILVDAVIVVLLLPGLLLTLGAGFMFGVLHGGIYVIIGTTIGSLLAFLIARRLTGTKYAQYFLHDQRLQLIEGAIKRRGWGTVLLTRLIPFFPFKLSNYFFGLTGYALIDFLIGTFLGIMPITFCNAYLGSLAANLTLLGTPEATRSPLQWAIYGIGFIIILGIFITATHMAQKNFPKIHTRIDTKSKPATRHN